MPTNGLIHRALENLLVNALRHTSPGGHIDITISEDADRVRIDVVDDGDGIASHEIPHIFERFYRPDTEPAESGHGLGLAIVKRIMELHRTRVEVSSDGEEGTAFSFWLPQAALLS